MPVYSLFVPGLAQIAFYLTFLIEIFKFLPAVLRNHNQNGVLNPLMCHYTAQTCIKSKHCVCSTAIHLHGKYSYGK